MKNSLIGFLTVLAGAISCGSPPRESNVGSGTQGLDRAVPKPIRGGDFLPAAPHHRAGIIHQFLPGPTATGFDGEWAEPNEITDFNGTVAQVYMGGTAVDNSGRHYIVDVDNRVYQGEFIATNGERAFGTFCEI